MKKDKEVTEKKKIKKEKKVKERKEKSPREFTEADEKKYKKVSKIVVIVIFIIGILVSCDILLVTKANVGPFLAIRTKVYDDGGTKEYYGLGYKVIKYNQEVGRRDTVLGSWGLKYSTEPTSISSMDLALEFRNYPEETYEKLYHQFLRITGTISEVNVDDKLVTLRYTDPEGNAYTLNIECHMIDEELDLSMYGAGQEMTIIGILEDYRAKDGNTPATVEMINCFGQ